MSWDKVGTPTRLRHWYGDMEVESHIYTLGLAGERFFKTLKDKGKLLASRCPRCGDLTVPARAFCEICFSETIEYVELDAEGIVDTYTAVSIDLNGKDLDKPIIVAFIRFPGARGGLVHRLGEIDPEKVHIGMRVRAVFKPKEERTGSINDIKYFMPVE